MKLLLHTEGQGLAGDFIETILGVIPLALCGRLVLGGVAILLEGIWATLASL